MEEKAIYVVTSETLRIIYEHIQQNFSRREGSDGHFSLNNSRLS